MYDRINLVESILNVKTAPFEGEASVDEVFCVHRGFAPHEGTDCKFMLEEISQTGYVPYQLFFGIAG